MRILFINQYFYPDMAASMLRYGGRYPGAYLLRRGLFLPRELPALLGAERAREGLRRLRPLSHIADILPPTRVQRTKAKEPHNNTHLTPFAKIALLESSLYMRNQLLRDTDWASMAHSLEVRVPLVDAVLFCSLAPLLGADKLPNRKHLLAYSPAKPLPCDVVSRVKTGFTTPIGLWEQRSQLAQECGQNVPASRRYCQWARRWGLLVKPCSR